MSEQKNRQQAGQTLREYIDEKYANDPQLKERVDAMVREMEAAMDAFDAARKGRDE